MKADEISMPDLGDIVGTASTGGSDIGQAVRWIDGTPQLLFDLFPLNDLTCERRVGDL